MMSFFPSKTLSLYLMRLFVTRILAVLLMLVLVLQMLDLLGESGKILAYPGNGEHEVWVYVSLRVPQLIARFLPYSALLATIITLVSLNQNSEVIAMKAAGLSAHQVLAPLILAALAVSITSFAFNERVVSRASSTLKAWQAAEFGPLPKGAVPRINVYLPDGPNILNAGTISGEGAQMRMGNVTWYRRDPQGRVVEQWRSALATYANPGWRLEAPQRYQVTLPIRICAPSPLIVPAFRMFKPSGR